MPSFKGQRVVIIGDSLSLRGATPGAKLGGFIRGAGGIVDVIALGGFAVSYFRDAIRLNNRKWGRPAQQMIERAKAFQPTLVLVLLGTNDYGQSSISIIAGVRELLKQLSGVPIIFLGPPQVRAGLVAYKLDVRKEMGRVDKSIKASATNYLSSFPLSEDLTGGKYKAKDGIHFTAEGAKIYGSRLFYAVQAKLSGASERMPPGNVLLGAFMVWGALRLIDSYMSSPKRRGIE